MGPVPYRFTTYSKILILIILVLIPILLLYYFSNRISNQVIREEIELSNLNQLSFLSNQLDSKMEQLSMFPVLLSYDPHIRQYIDNSPELQNQMLKEQSRVIEKLGLQSVSSDWPNELSIVIPKQNRMLSSSIFLNPDEVWTAESNIRSVWTYITSKDENNRVGSFVREIAEPASASLFSQARAVYQIRFSGQNLIDMLNNYMVNKNRNPFLFHRHYEPLYSSNPSTEISDQIMIHIRANPLRDSSGQFTIEANDQLVLVSYVQSIQLGWYLVDYVPVQKILMPITTISRLFYLSIGLLLLLGAFASSLLYSQVQKPILALMASVQRFKRGDFSARITYRSNNEFDFLIRRFNEMAVQIQVLIEDVYAERIRSREATLKQLQSQINPHFLYNSLFFIINSSAMKDNEAVEAMAHNLAEFYRYSTRVEDQSVTLSDELDMVRHYLTIQNLRMHRLTYTISVPEEMLNEHIPRLILQPLVENAIIHGIENQVGGGYIQVRGEQDDQVNRIIIEDNGEGMTEEQLTNLHNQLNQSMTKEIGCGTWNVHHRLLNQFGEGSGLKFISKPEGGLRVVLTWNRNVADEIYKESTEV